MRPVDTTKGAAKLSAAAFDVISVAPMGLSADLSDWTDFDVASHALGRAIGVFPLDQAYEEAKPLFDAATDVSNGLADMLLGLVQMGVLEEDKDGKFRWNPGFQQPTPAS